MFHYHTDHIGTPREITNSRAEVVWSSTFKTYGALALAHVNEVDNPLRFQGQYYDEETGLHYNRHRYYDPNSGQFTTQDPIGLHGGMNAYQYAPNPMTWVDPWGLSGQALFRGVHAKHPAISSSKQGVAEPAVAQGGSSAIEHNLGGHSGQSQYTSWTRNRDIAEYHANKSGPGGVVLEAPVGAPKPEETWSWELSDDAYMEDEVLLKGRRENLKVNQCG